MSKYKHVPVSDDTGRCCWDGHKPASYCHLACYSCVSVTCMEEQGKMRRLHIQVGSAVISRAISRPPGLSLSLPYHVFFPCWPAAGLPHVDMPVPVPQDNVLCSSQLAGSACVQRLIGCWSPQATTTPRGKLSERPVVQQSW